MVQVLWYAVYLMSQAIFGKIKADKYSVLLPIPIIIRQQNNNYNELIKIIIIMTIIILKKCAAMINPNLNQRFICAMRSSSVSHMYMYLSCADTTIGHVNEYPTMHYFGIPRQTQSMIAYKYFWKFQ